MAKKKSNKDSIMAHKIKVGQVIRAIRTEHGLSQSDLGKILGLHQTAICRLEQGLQNLMLSDAVALARHFKIDPKEVLLRFFD
jgi:transcriptional regulator with XRE-family HTH domain